MAKRRLAGIRERQPAGWKAGSVKSALENAMEEAHNTISAHEWSDKPGSAKFAEAHRQRLRGIERVAQMADLSCRCKQVSRGPGLGEQEYDCKCASRRKKRR